jgi:hypothetical protein
MPMSPRLLRPRAAGGFNPKTVSGLVGWWDPSDSATVTTVSGAVSQLNDKSGLGRNATQGTANNRPSYSGTINGKNVMTFDGTNDFMVTGLESNTLTGFATFFCVCQASADWTDADANNKSPLYGRNSSDLGASYGLTLSTISGNLGLNLAWRGTQFNATNGPTVAKGTPQLLVGALSSTTRFRRVNGTAADIALPGTAGTNAAAGNFLNIGQDPPAGVLNRYWKNLIGEILVYDRTLTTDEIKKIESYLGKKYGITVAT